MKKVFKILAILSLLVFITACDLSTEETFTEDNFKITLTDDFYKKDNLSSTYYYESTDVGIVVTFEDFESLEEANINSDSHLEDYLEMIEYANGEKYDSKKSENGKYYYFDYTASVSGKEFYYISAIYKGKTGFWLVTSYCENKNKDELRPVLLKYLNTVEV